MSLEADGFTDPIWQDIDPNASYGLFLQIDTATGCDLIAGAYHSLTVTSGGHLVGQFTVPADGRCFQFNPTGDPQPVLPGTYTIGIGCHTCSIAIFRVTGG